MKVLKLPRSTMNAHAARTAMRDAMEHARQVVANYPPDVVEAVRLRLRSSCAPDCDVELAAAVEVLTSAIERDGQR